MSIAIRAEHVSKEYRLGVINHGMLYKDFQSWMARRLGRADPHGKLGEDHFQTTEDTFWALKDVSFDIHEGDRVGIIGKNGAGKSTLLKILSRITAPTEGKIKIRGRVASLLEVGTGFHGELTGRENIYLNGAILGMKKREIDYKIDEIIDFSGIENHIDTPVKRYSSGMYVRLAFAVAAHLDSEILLADEVLAVGDVEFQKKALGKMQDLSTGQGKTVLFVSHNTLAVESLCTNGILLNRGRVEVIGEVTFVTSKYLNNKGIACQNIIDEIDTISDIIEITEILANGNSSNVINIDRQMNRLNIKIKGKIYERIDGGIELIFRDEHSRAVAYYSPCHFESGHCIEQGFFSLEESLDLSRLVNGVYYVDINISNPRERTNLVSAPKAITIYCEGVLTIDNCVHPNKDVGYFIL